MIAGADLKIMAENLIKPERDSAINSNHIPLGQL